MPRLGAPVHRTGIGQLIGACVCGRDVGARSCGRARDHSRRGVHGGTEGTAELVAGSLAGAAEGEATKRIGPVAEGWGDGCMSDNTDVTTEGMRCPNCRRAIGKAAEEGGVLLRGSPYLLLTKAGGLVIKCPRCGESIEVLVKSLRGPVVVLSPYPRSDGEVTES